MKNNEKLPSGQVGGVLIGIFVLFAFVGHETFTNVVVSSLKSSSALAPIAIRIDNRASNEQPTALLSTIHNFNLLHLHQASEGLRSWDNANGSRSASGQRELAVGVFSDKLDLHRIVDVTLDSYRTAPNTSLSSAGIRGDDLNFQKVSASHLYRADYDLGAKLDGKSSAVNDVLSRNGECLDNSGKSYYSSEQIEHRMIIGFLMAVSGFFLTMLSANMSRHDLWRKYLSWGIASLGMGGGVVGGILLMYMTALHSR